MRTRWRVHADALTSLLAMALGAAFIWWLLATLNGAR